jgi:SOS-response transcriptional repressor LexA
LPFGFFYIIPNSYINAIIYNFFQISNILTQFFLAIPLYNFYAAAGTFSEIQSEKDFVLIEGSENTNKNSDYFACKIVGESMNRVIPNGSICLFKPYNGGSRNGKIVLVENMDIQDHDFNSAFTIKTYSSEKIVSEEGWEHTSIVLRPN